MCQVKSDHDTVKDYQKQLIKINLEQKNIRRITKVIWYIPRKLQPFWETEKADIFNYVWT